MEKSRKIAKILVLFLLLCMVIGSTVYLNQCYEADTVALAAMEKDNVTLGKNTIIFTPEGECRAGFLFYPGGQVAPEAYAPLMQRLCDRGFLCIIVKMPCNLAILAQNRAEGITEQYPEISHWFMGGHSLGGVSAANYLSSHEDEVEALVFLASYTVADLSHQNLKVLSIVGSEDLVLGSDSAQLSRDLLPLETDTLTIEGGCHALFGNYGPQKGDGTPTITADEQQDITADAIAALLD